MATTIDTRIFNAFTCHQNPLFGFTSSNLNQSSSNTPISCLNQLDHYNTDCELKLQSEGPFKGSDTEIINKAQHIITTHDLDVIIISKTSTHTYYFKWFKNKDSYCPIELHNRCIQFVQLNHKPKTTTYIMYP